MLYKRTILWALILLLALGCQEQDDTLPMTDDPPVPVEVAASTMLSTPITIEMNPYGLTPLAGVARVKSIKETNVEMQIPGAYPVVAHSPTSSFAHEILILGLYPGKKNDLVFKISSADGTSFGYDTLSVEAPPLPDFLPEIEIIERQESLMEPGWNLIEMSLGGEGYFRFYPLIFDPGGQVRWYMNLDFIQGWIGPFDRLRNGNWLWAHGQTLYEYDMLGKEANRWDIPGFYQHHDQIEKPNGNLIICVSKEGLDTRLDHIVELDRSTGAIVREWDLRQVLDVDRFDLAWNSTDWLHVNSVWHDETNGGLLISGRHQGILKVSDDNQLEWILAPHKGWGQAGPAGNGLNTADYLLTAVNGAGTPYGQQAQLGTTDASGFSWPWGQHASMILPNGNIFCFDNSWNKNFGNDAPFIRGVEYRINPAEMTVQQVWEYGKERGSEIQSSNISDVDLLPVTGNRLISPGNIQGAGVRQGRLIEVSYPEGKVVFEAVVKYTNAFSNGNGWANSDIIYRAERLPLYPE
ncbi:MAG: aryl-sulfate sulfotransferase [Phaeodactylibacter sp.]|nr:aryl-sulfate sulfotransferase [Phaeodactylibacter sp.]MCB9052717.1 aryl-sulfate sulfotransferase [Lewinellaceae bacterium]